MTGPAAGTAQQFADALVSPSASARAVLDEVSLLASRDQALAAAGRLRQYLEFLTRARAAKAAKPNRGDGIDRQVLARAPDVLTDAHTFAVAAVGTIGQMANSGVLDELTRNWFDAASASGEVSTAELWNYVTGQPSTRDQLRGAGVDDATFSGLDQLLKSFDVRVLADGDQLLISGDVNGQTAQAALAITPRPPRAVGVKDLLTRGNFDALAGAIAAGQPAYLGGVPMIGGQIRADDTALLIALALEREAVRHVRKLQDTGLDTHTGAALPAAVFISLWIGCFLLAVVGAVGTHFACPPQGQPRSTACTIFGVMLGIGYYGMMALGLGLFIGASRQASGTTTTYGVLTDFDGAGA